MPHPGHWKSQIWQSIVHAHKKLVNLAKEQNIENCFNTKAKSPIDTCYRSIGWDIGGRKLCLGVVSLGKKNATRRSLGASFPPSLNVVWGGSLGSSFRKTWGHC